MKREAAERPNLLGCDEINTSDRGLAHPSLHVGAPECPDVQERKSPSGLPASIIRPSPASSLSLLRSQASLLKAIRVWIGKPDVPCNKKY
ncbi:hypothetical protein MPTK1_7g04040 [Marchantia polymorpha subsp. ruderalis]|uniref:Uncharacterized protein n=2 Tax=Marchantia polymorpha TaxID=3197 RepID=A0AAF6BVY7_MARPO|nr:hypothetical protein MARPO_0062s0121 [Marchantia polymorpha]BBN16171.1 hypothetical protein Mp_7g04040 [Marchantia polymorpha subsp. ruderalis]|eukprot:PTQ36711.1 hypothetical protein MARPO_0062s0121 [Marchantia polymorpha]